MNFPPLHIRFHTLLTFGRLACLLPPIALSAAEPMRLPSPDGQLVALIHTSVDGRLTFAIEHGGVPVIHPSPLGMTLENTDLGAPVSLGQPERQTINERYPWLGGKSSATNHCHVYRVPVLREPGTLRWTLEVRTFNDGVAYRYHVPGTGLRHVTGEQSSWTLPERSVAWFQRDTTNYEGEYESAPAESMPLQAHIKSDPQPVHFGPPVTVELPGGLYALLTEAKLLGYSGMTLRPTKARRLEAVFLDDPDGWTIEGPIVTPWRVTIVAADLNALVNSDVVFNLCDAPDPDIFPQGAHTDWIRPGRALITWTVFGNDGAQWHRQKWFVDHCAALRCEYLLVDAGWLTERWGWFADGGDPWSRLKELCDYAATQNVGIVVWHAYPEGRDDGPGLVTPQARQELFLRCREAGVKGVKIDFFDSESMAIVDVCDDLRRLAARHRLLINFHGANKPTGESRTWPNEITREGIREQEYLLWDKLSLSHYAALPFSRMIVGHSDFLPTYVRPQYLKNTTAVFQMATAIVATSPFLCWPDHPEDYRASPFLHLIQNLPVAWDETRVLPESAIGKLAAFARRSGDAWFVGVLNAQDKPRNLDVEFNFLSSNTYNATLFQDSPPFPRGITSNHHVQVRNGDRIKAALAPGGGFVAWLTASPTK
jgi:alpha-glucosidase